MNTLQTPSTFSNNIPQQARIPTDFIVVCLWTTLGLTLSTLAFALGFGTQVAQALGVTG